MLSRIVLLTLPEQPLNLWLELPPSPDFTGISPGLQRQRHMTALALVCRHWREAVRLALGLTTWNVVANYEDVGRYTPHFSKLRAALQTLSVVDSYLKLSFVDAAAPLLL